MVQRSREAVVDGVDYCKIFIVMASEILVSFNRRFSVSSRVSSSAVMGCGICTNCLSSSDTGSDKVSYSSLDDLNGTSVVSRHSLSV